MASDQARVTRILRDLVANKRKLNKGDMLTFIDGTMTILTYGVIEVRDQRDGSCRQSIDSQTDRPIAIHRARRTLAEQSCSMVVISKLALVIDLTEAELRELRPKIEALLKTHPVVCLQQPRPAVPSSSNPSAPSLSMDAVDALVPPEDWE